MPRGAEHHLGARGAAAALGVGGQVVRPEIRLDLDQPSPQTRPIDLADQQLAEQVARHDPRISFKERRLEDSALSRWAF